MARYYKIINEENFKKADSLLDEIKLLNSANKEFVKEAIPFENINFYGYTSCGTLFIKGFSPLDKTIYFEGFKQKKDGIFYPNKQTKKGKEIQKILNNQKTIDFFDIINILQDDVTIPNKSFTSPMLYKLKTDEIVLQCDSNVKLDKQKYEEITLTYLEENY